MKHLILISMLALLALSCQETDPAAKNTYSISVQIGDGEISFIEVVTLHLLADDQIIAIGTGPSFTFENLEEGKNYTVIPQSPAPSHTGMSTLDIVMIDKHLNGEIQLNPFEQIAADVNRDDIISAVDQDIIRNCITSSGNCPAWRFATSDYNGTGIGSKDQFKIQHLIADQQVTFLQIKLGDINCTTCPG